MEEHEVVQYLANVLAVARADGAFGAREEAAMESIRLAIKGKKSELNKACGIVDIKVKELTG